MTRKIFASLLAVGLSFAMVMAPGTATAEDEPTSNPVTKVVETVQKLVQPKSKDVSKSNDVSTSSHVAAPDPPDSDSDSTGNETENPSGPDHGSTRGVETNLLGEDLVGLNNDNAKINDDDSTSADSTVLSLGGKEVVGAHADSKDPNTEKDFDILFPLCDGSGGAICVGLLYSHARASEDGGTSSSKSQSGVFRACLGGTTTDPFAECNGPLHLGVSQSSAEANRNKSTGQTDASAEYSAVDALGVQIVGSEGTANSGGEEPSASRGSFVLVDENGNEVLPKDLSIPEGCPAVNLFCLFLNQGETYLSKEDRVAGTAQDALILRALSGTPLAPVFLFAGVGHTETLVHNDGRKNPPGRPDDPDDPDPDDPDDPDDDDADEGDDADDDDDDRALPGTGGPSSALLALGLLGVGLGGATIAYGRRARSLREQG